MTRSIDTGINGRVKLPQERTSCEEKDQIERQLSELLLDEVIRVSESPLASPVLRIGQEE